MTIEFSKDERGQYHFFHLVHEPGHFGRMFIFDYEKSLWRENHFEEERLNVGEFLGKHTKEIKRLGLDNCFTFLGEPNAYPADEEIKFVDKETGLLVGEIFFEEIGGHTYAEKKSYKPTSLAKYSYERMEVELPIVDKKVKGQMMTMRSWTVDSKLRRRYRNEAMSLFVVFDQKSFSTLGAERRVKRVYIESGFDIGEEETSVSKPMECIEKWRSYFVEDEMFNYFASEDLSKLVFVNRKDPDFSKIDFPGTPRLEHIYKVGDRVLTKEEIPSDMGAPRRILF